ncbi:MAG: hypothetical protein JWO77_682, partial [Ilumatobacteraceae bacterium]|nr:hypothetical protein [Ilumatobacteraceae bacterium]
MTETDADVPPGTGDDALWQGVFASYAEEAMRKLPLYRHLCLGVADDAEVARRLAV